MEKTSKVGVKKQNGSRLVGTMIIRFKVLVEFKPDCPEFDKERRPIFIEMAEFKYEQYDCIYGISAIKHIPDADILAILQHARRVLKPGGLFVIRLDLFLDIEPFTTSETNRYGKKCFG